MHISTHCNGSDRIPYNARIVPQSQTCPSCLTELARIRAIPDPYYGLPIVVCPTCKAASVRTRHHDIEFWRGFRRFHSVLRIVFAKALLMLIFSGLMTLLILSAGDVFMPFGRFNPSFPFTSGDAWSILSAVGILIGSVLLTASVSVLIRHKPIYQSLLIFLILTTCFLTIDYSVSWSGIMLAKIGNFQPRHHLPTNSEMMRRFSQFGFLFAISIIGLIPAIPLRMLIDRAPKRRFRRLLRKRRKQRTSND